MNNRQGTYYPPSGNNDPWGARDPPPRTFSDNRPRPSQAEYYEEEVDERQVYRQPPPYYRPQQAQYEEVDDIVVQPVFKSNSRQVYDPAQFEE